MAHRCLITAKFLYQLPLFCGSPPLTLRTSSKADDLAICFSSVAAASDNPSFRLSLPSRLDYVLGLHK